jgi:hypothetical protein
MPIEKENNTLTVEQSLIIAQAWKANKKDFRNKLRNPDTAKLALDEVGIHLDAKEVDYLLKDYKGYDERKLSELLEERISKGCCGTVPSN